ncbi:MAG: fluoride efflux transporter CrcB [Candidatus Eremiobacteraeota bacterium]|nr:fluoride efflux transporter CrcB [Candidatus Eremiobacteraeota bacterium]
MFVGGGIGSVLRYAVTLVVTQRFGPGFPWATFAINITGSLIIGLVFELSQTRALGVTPLVRIFLVTGVLGGYTTFSTFSLDMVTLASERAFNLALLYGAGSVIIGFIAAYAGIVAVRALHP